MPVSFTNWSDKIFRVVTGLRWRPGLAELTPAGTVSCMYQKMIGLAGLIHTPA